MEDKIVYVKTPNGVRQHGWIHNDKFRRRVKEKDKMRIFDAWSINPSALKQIMSKDVRLIEYLNEDESKVYYTDVETMVEKGFEKTFNGGKTRYLPIKEWNIRDKK